MISFSLANGRPEVVKERVSGRRNLRAVTAIALCGLISMPASAFAEGGWSSSLDKVRDGFQSRYWDKRNGDHHNTILEISGCSRSDDARFILEVELWQYHTILPNLSLGRGNFNECPSLKRRKNWGSPKEGNTYFLQFFHYNFGTVSARSVKLAY